MKLRGFQRPSRPEARLRRRRSKPAVLGLIGRRQAAKAKAARPLEYAQRWSRATATERKPLRGILSQMFHQLEPKVQRGRMAIDAMIYTTLVAV